MNTKGRFITLEGIEGAGKSTQLGVVGCCLQDAGIDFVATREPGGSAIGEQIRGLLLDPDSNGMDSGTELLLIFAARCEHLARVVRPALEQGVWVVCDRFTDATYAYQGGGRGVDLARIAVLEDYVQGSLRPNLTLLLDLPVAAGLGRSGKRSSPDRFEREDADFFVRVRAKYLEIARSEPHRVAVIDAEPPLERVSDQIRASIAAFLAREGQ